MKKVLSVLLALALAAACAGCGGTGVGSGEGETAATMLLERSEGAVTVADGAGKAQALREKLPLYSGYGVSTGAASFGWLSLDSTKLAKLDEGSAASIEKEGKQLKLQLDSGRLYFDLTAPLAEDESFEICTGNMTVGIRGTCGWVDAETQTVYILRGAVVCSSEAAGEFEAEITPLLCARCEADGSIRPDRFDPEEIPQFALAELEEGLLQELELGAGRADGQEGPPEIPGPADSSEPEAAGSSEPPAAPASSKATAYGSGTVSLLGVSEDGSTVEFTYQDGVMTYAEYDWDGKGAWGGDSPNAIERQPFYGLTVEELAEKVEGMGFTVTIR